MVTTTNTNVVVRRGRYNELKTTLEDRRRHLVQEVQTKIRDARIDSTLERGVLDQGESSEVDIQDEMGFALIQMKAETLDKIDAALGRLGEGTYGECVECGDEIAQARLWALPFALRCTECEEAREAVEQRDHFMARRLGSSAFFLDLPN
jgi:DnaK suppressor protein